MGPAERPVRVEGTREDTGRAANCAPLVQGCLTGSGLKATDKMVHMMEGSH
jgi:hypothetical protein